MKFRTFHWILCLHLTFLPGGLLWAEQTLSLFYLSADAFDAQSLSLQSSYFDQWYLQFGAGAENESTLDGKDRANFWTADAITAFDSPWQGRIGIDQWDGEDSVRLETIEAQLDFNANRWSAGVFVNKRDITLTARTVNDVLTTRKQRSTAVGVELRYLVNSRIDMGARYTQHDYDFRPESLDVVRRPLLLLLLPSSSLGVASGLVDEDLIIYSSILVGLCELGLQLGFANSAVDDARSEGQALYADFGVSDHVSLVTEIGRQSTENEPWFEQVGIGARINW